MSGTAPGLARRTIDSPIGALQMFASPAGLRAVLWPDEDGSRVGRSLAVPAESIGPAYRAEGYLLRAAEQLEQYFAGGRQAFDVPLDVSGTDFQLRAWDVLSTIPFGRTISYRDQAAALGDPARARAVGAANGRNPISIIVPCHRVVASSGALTGFAGGMDTKAWLLEHELRVLAGACEPAST